MNIERIAFTTDFGQSDHYVAVTKSVILRNTSRRVDLLDVSHNIERQNILKAAYVSAVAAKWMDADTLHLVVVDPTVGTKRAIVIYVTDSNGVFVAPDNGVLTHAYQWFNGEAFFYRPTSSEGVSATFHARDVFAPLVARLVNGESPNEFCMRVSKQEIAVFDCKRPLTDGKRATGVVLYVDNFGNMITNIPNGWLTGTRFTLKTADGVHPLKRVATYSDGEPHHELILVEGSEGFYEVAVNMDSAASRVKLTELQSVTIIEE